MVIDARISVLQIVAGLDIGRRYGGAERAGVELARRLKRDGFDLTVCSFWRYQSETESYWIRLMQAEGINVCFASQKPHCESTSEFARAVRSIARQLTVKPIDIVHAHHEGGALAGLL